MSDRLIVSSSPHVGSCWTTQRIMLAVIVSLVPSTVASIYYFGFYPLFVMLLSVASAVLTELVFNKITKKPVTVGDLSAVVTGMILALNLPPVVPIYLPVIGSVFAVAVVKMLFGGLGKNFANPAATARVFLLLSFSSAMTTFVNPVNYGAGATNALFGFFSGMGNGLDAVSSATPLVAIKNGNPGATSVLDMFLGATGGSAGETCAIAVLLGGLFLMLLKIIDWKIPLTMLGTVVLSTLIFYDYNYILPMLLSGGMLFGAFFMATDYATSPNTGLGRIIFAAGVGFITILIRRFGGYPEGVTLAILLMNLVVPLIDKGIVPKRFGKVSEKHTRGGNNAA